MPQRAAWTRKQFGKLLQPAAWSVVERCGKEGRERTGLGRADVTVTLHFYYGVQNTICIVQKIIKPSFQPSNCFELLQ